MKKHYLLNKRYLLLALFWLGTAWHVAAQQRVAAVAPAPVDSLRQYLGNMFANVDKTQVPTPYLEEYGYRFLPLRLFNGALVDSNRTTLTLWRQLYATVVSGNINGPDDLPVLSDLNAQIRAQTSASNAIPLVIQRIDYATLRPDAIQAGLLRGQNDQLFDVPARSASPYLLKTLFAAAPARNVASMGSVSFVFPQNLHVQSGGGTVQSLAIDFGDGRGYLAAVWGQPIAAAYTTAGTKRIKVKLAYSEVFAPSLTKKASTVKSSVVPGSPIASVSFESQFDLQVVDPAADAGTNPVTQSGASTKGTAGTQGAGGTAGYVYHGGTDSLYFAPNANHSGGWVYFVYGGLNRRYLSKPLIVAEGYDVSRIAPDIQPNYSVRDFLRNIRVNNFQSGAFNFFDALGNDNPATNTTAYDLVFIDYNNGTDDIRRNAALFEQVVQYVNANKQGGTSTGQRNVVLGISMGGLVARYGLAQLEKAQPGSTHTRLLVTQDSPHRGANTPLGLQALVRQVASTYLGVYISSLNSSGILHSINVGDIFPELRQGDLLLDEPATKQLLLVRATVQRYAPFAWASTYGVEFNSFVDGDYRTMINPPASGFPYRFVATSLGSQCGKSTLSPYDELVRIEAGGYLNLATVSTGIHTQVVVNALPNPGQVQRLSGLQVWNQVRVLIFTRKFYLSKLAYQSPAANRIAWDGLPGGVQYVNGQLPLTTGTNSGTKLWGIVGYYNNVALANTFCFVPSVSALDVPVLDDNTARASFVNGYTSSTSPPLAETYIAEVPHYDRTTGTTAYNSPHPFFTGRQSQWIYNEMERPFNGNTNPTACDSNPECNPAPPRVITGPQNVCGTATYSAPVIAGAVYNWTTSPAGAFSPATGSGPTFTTTGTGPNSGQVAVAVVSPCSSNSFTATLAVAVCNQFSVAITSLVYNNNCRSTSGQPNYALWTAAATGGNGPTTYAWYVDYSGTGNSFTGPVSNGTTFGTCLNGYTRIVQVKVVATNNGQQATALYYAQPQARMAMYPNPADGYVDVANDAAGPSGANMANATPQAAAVTTAPAEAAPMQVTVYNGQGQAVFTAANVTAPSVRLNTQNWPDGLYQVNTQRGQTITRRQLSVQHNH